MSVSGELLQAERTICRIHEAIRSGDEPLVDELNEQLTEISLDLQSGDLDLINGLSADLYSISEAESRFPLAMLGIIGEGDANLALTSGLVENDWLLVLKVLRSRELNLEPDWRAYLRATAYERLGLNEAPALFYRLAIRHNPGKPAYRYLLLSWLTEKSPVDAKRAATELTESNYGDAAVLTRAYWTQMQSLEDAVRADLVHRAVESLSQRRALRNLVAHTPQVAASTLLKVGFFHELLREDREARQLYMSASALDPASREAKELLHGISSRFLRDPESDKNADESMRLQLTNELLLGLAA